ncbi:MAG: hypothetical protein ACREQ9_03335, partial [Candidatus Binatia bacterium]
LGVHHVTALLCLPIVAALAAGAPRARSGRAEAVAALFGLALGLLAYAHLPLAAGRAPVLAWDDLATWGGFWHHVSGGHARGALRVADAAALRRFAGELFPFVLRQLTPAGVVVAAAGLVALWRSERRLLAALAAVAILDASFLASFSVPNDRDAYLLPLIVAMTFAFACGGAWLLRRTAASAGLYAVATALLLAIPAVNLAFHWEENDRGSDSTARDFVANALRSVGRGELLLSFHPELHAPHFYLRHVEGFRRDATVVLASSLRMPWYVRDYLPREYPALMSACAAEAAALVEAIRRRDVDRVEVDRRWFDLVRAIVAHGLRQGKVYVLPPVDRRLREAFHSVPVGLVLRLSPEPPVELE